MLFIKGLRRTNTSSYTSGRFLYNENLRRQERYVGFNVEAFKELAAQGIGPGHGKVTNITKFAEGGFNRVFLLTHGGWLPSCCQNTL